MNDTSKISSLLKTALINGSWKDFLIDYIDTDMNSRYPEIDTTDRFYFWELFRRVLDDWKDAFDAVNQDNKPSWSDFVASVWTMPGVAPMIKCFIIRSFCGQRFQVLLESNFVELSESCIKNLFKEIYDEVFDQRSSSELESRYRFAAYVSNASRAEKAQTMQWVKSELQACTIQALQDRYTQNRELPERGFYDFARAILAETRRLYNVVLRGSQHPERFPFLEDHNIRSLDDLYLFSLHPYNWNDDPQQIVERLLEIRDASGHQAASRAFLLDDSRVIKYSDHGLLEEVIAMELVRNKTTVPVPQALMTFVQYGQTFLVMTRVDGEDLEHKRYKMSAEQLAMIAGEVAQHVKSIRRLGTLLIPSESATPPLIGSWFGGPLVNIIFDPASCSAFQSGTDLQSYWEQRLKRHRPVQIPDSFKVVLSHGDLNPRNIMIRDGHVIGIIDRDTFGWYPDFWEIMMMTRQAEESVEVYMTRAFLAELGTTAETEELRKAISDALYEYY